MSLESLPQRLRSLWHEDASTCRSISTAAHLGHLVASRRKSKPFFLTRNTRFVGKDETGDNRYRLTRPVATLPRAQCLKHGRAMKCTGRGCRPRRIATLSRGCSKVSPYDGLQLIDTARSFRLDCTTTDIEDRKGCTCTRDARRADVNRRRTRRTILMFV